MHAGWDRRAAAWLAAAQQSVRVVTAADHHPRPSEARSYVGDGRLVVLAADGPAGEGWRFAVDAERRGQAPPSYLAQSRHFSSQSDFWRSWTQFEVACKLHDRPVAHALSIDADRLYLGVSLCSFDLEDLAVCVGFLP